MKTFLTIVAVLAATVGLFTTVVFILGAGEGMTFSQGFTLAVLSLGGMKVSEKCWDRVEKIKKEDYYG